jgi:hypothetical protein
MLTRCSAANKCCPKFPEEDFSDPLASQATANLYCNPYMLEELTGPGSMPDHGDFPPGAISLMYSPPLEAEHEDSDGDVDEWMRDYADRRLDNVGHLMRMPPSAAQTRTASPGAALKMNRQGEARMNPTKEPEVLKTIQRQSTGEGARRSPSEPPSYYSTATPSAASRSSRSQTPTATTPRRCAGDAGDVQPSVDPEFYSKELENPWLAAQMNFRGRRMFADENNTRNTDIGAASISTIKKCIAKAQYLPEQQRPNSEKWTERWSNIQMSKKEVVL